MVQEGIRAGGTEGAMCRPGRGESPQADGTAGAGVLTDRRGPDMGARLESPRPKKTRVAGAAGGRGQ